MYDTRGGGAEYRKEIMNKILQTLKAVIWYRLNSAYAYLFCISLLLLITSIASWFGLVAGFGILIVLLFAVLKICYEEYRDLNS